MECEVVAPSEAVEIDKVMVDREIRLLLRISGPLRMEAIIGDVVIGFAFKATSKRMSVR